MVSGRLFSCNRAAVEHEADCNCQPDNPVRNEPEIPKMDQRQNTVSEFTDLTGLKQNRNRDEIAKITIVDEIRENDPRQQYIQDN
ncbi:hypothetical protein D3C73_1341830 [compost metagenome]